MKTNSFLENVCRPTCQTYENYESRGLEIFVLTREGIFNPPPYH